MLFWLRFCEAEQYLGSYKPAKGPSTTNKPANKSAVNNISIDKMILDQVEHEYIFSQNLGEPIPE